MMMVRLCGYISAFNSLLAVMPWGLCVLLLNVKARVGGLCSTGKLHYEEILSCFLPNVSEVEVGELVYLLTPSYSTAMSLLPCHCLRTFSKRKYKLGGTKSDTFGI